MRYETYGTVVLRMVKLDNCGHGVVRVRLWSYEF